MSAPPTDALAIIVVTPDTVGVSTAETRLQSDDVLGDVVDHCVGDSGHSDVVGGDSVNDSAANNGGNAADNDTEDDTDDDDDDSDDDDDDDDDYSGPALRLHEKQRVILASRKADAAAAASADHLALLEAEGALELQNAKAAVAATQAHIQRDEAVKLQKVRCERCEKRVSVCNASAFFLF
jgi:hypothetical protein